MDAHSRRAAALDALDRVISGVRPTDLESDTLEFKEERGTSPHGKHQPIPPQYEPAAKLLAEAAACLANTNTGGVIVVGVDDKARGRAALVGSHLDTTWLRERIYALTMPHLAVDVIEERHVEGTRVYLVNVAPALEEIRCDGKLRARVGTRCEELSGDQARQFLEVRRRYDWSAEASGFRLSDILPAALAIARRYYEEKHGRAPASDSALVSQLGLLASVATAARSSDTPVLNNAGALLLCQFEPGLTQLDVIATRVEGVVSRRRQELQAPALVAFESAWQFLRESFPATPMVLGPRRREVRAVPERAFREALVNAIAHRDYRQPFSRIMALVIGEPATTLKLRSPGGFPPGVRPDRLLTTPSRPRNPILANALHVLGFGESEGIGIDTMYLEMLRDGHVEPIIAEDTGDVLCILNGGQTDPQVRTFFDELGMATPSLRENVRACIAVTQLLATTTLRPEALAMRAQCADLEALGVLEELTLAGVTDRLITGSRSFRLTDSARDRLRNRLAYTPRATLDEHWQMIRAYLDPNESINREEAARLLRVKPLQGSRILSELYNERGLIRPVGSPRGRGVRYRLVVADEVSSALGKESTRTGTANPDGGTGLGAD